MTLYIDIGNTNVKFMINGEVENIPTKSNPEDILNKLQEKVKGIDLIITASVVKPVGNLINEKVEELGIPLYAFNNKKYGDFIDTTKIDFTQMGADRMLAMAAVNKDDNNIIVDLGTALTIDVLRGTTYLTGNIFPGLQLLINALYNETDALPKVELENIKLKEPLLNTETQISASIILGMCGMLNTTIKMIQKQYPSIDFKIFLIGNGFRRMTNALVDTKLSDVLEFSYELDFDLNIKGFRAIEEKIKGEANEERKY